jgi:hypothetical protein
MPAAIPAKKPLKALPEIIHFFKKHGYSLPPLPMFWVKPKPT